MLYECHMPPYPICGRQRASVDFGLLACGWLQKATLVQPETVWPDLGRFRRTCFLHFRRTLIIGGPIFREQTLNPCYYGGDLLPQEGFDGPR